MDYKKQFPSPPPETSCVWFLDEKSQWREGRLSGAVCTDRSSHCWTFFLSCENNSGKSASVTSSSCSAFPDEFEFDLVKNRSTEEAESLDELRFPNEPEVLRYLERMFKQKMFYHRLGNVVVFINPFEKIKESCETCVSNSSFFNAEKVVVLGKHPHAYDLAETAFSSMCSDRFNLENRTDQTIFVCGESGSGKTENTKLMLEYLLRLSMKVLQSTMDNCALESPRVEMLKQRGHSSKTVVFDGFLEGHCVAINKILESLGHACRLANSNSSCYGRAIELEYAAECYIENISIETFLLDAARVHTQCKGERNFHIFYELAAGISLQEKNDFGIEELFSFKYINNRLERYDNCSDKENFRALINAFDAIQVNEMDRDGFLKCVAALLHIGNISFKLDGDSAVFSDDGRNKIHVDFACRLLATSEENLRRVILHSAHMSSSSREQPIRPLDVAHAVECCNLFATTLYHSLFQWAIAHFNNLRLTNTMSTTCLSKISIIDLFGAENLSSNSLMQFCINYSNEKILDHFNKSIFLKEQQLYSKEDINWHYIEYSNSEKVVNLFESAEYGMLNMLESQARMQNPSDAKFLHHCQQNIKSRLYEPSRNQKSMKFTVVHTFGPVTYDCMGFSEKNKLAHSNSSVVEFFSNSSSAFVQSLAKSFEKESRQNLRHKVITSASRTKASTTVLQKQLDALLQKSSSSTSHWMMCLRPSPQCKPEKFDRSYVVNQIADCGLIPLAALSVKGWSHFLKFQDFVKKFFGLVLLAGKCSITTDFVLAREDHDWKRASVHLLSFVNVAEEMLDAMNIEVDRAEDSSINEQSFVFAKNGIFLKRAMFYRLERLSYRIRIMMAVRIQRHVRCRLFYQRLATENKSAVPIICNALAYFANVKFLKVMKKTNARIILQRFIRASLYQLRRMRRIKLIVMVQSRVRGHFVRRDLRRRQEFAVKLVQCRWLNNIRHKKFRRKWAAAIKIQRGFRRFRNALVQRLRNESVAKIQQLWRAKRGFKSHCRRRYSQLDDNRRSELKQQFLAELDDKLAADPDYLVNLVSAQEEVKRLTRRVDELKKLAVSRSRDMVTATNKLHDSKIEVEKLTTTVESLSKKNSGEEKLRGQGQLLGVLGKLQRWVSEKEKIRVSSVIDLAKAEERMTTIQFDSALRNQRIKEIEVDLDRKAKEYKEFEFSAVKTSHNASDVEYDLRAKQSELQNLKQEHSDLQAQSAKELKTLETKKSHCTILKSRIEANAPEIQLAEINFALSLLQRGITDLFSKNKPTERLKAGEQHQEPVGEGSAGQARLVSGNGPSSPYNAVSFRKFQVQPSTIRIGKRVVEKSVSMEDTSSPESSTPVKPSKKPKVKNLAPPNDKFNHKWHAKFLATPTWCMICKKFIPGLTITQQNAFRCRNCKIVAHRDCCDGFECECKSIVFDSTADVLVPANCLGHIWTPKKSSIEDKCEICATHISDKLPGKNPFQCKSCKVFGHRDCCAKVTKNRNCEPKTSTKSVFETISTVTETFQTAVDMISMSTVLEMNSHKFKGKYLSKPTWCAYCQRFIVGVTAKQQDAVKCTLCKVSCHRTCAIAYNEGDEAKRRVCTQSSSK